MIEKIRNFFLGSVIAKKDALIKDLQKENSLKVKVKCDKIKCFENSDGFCCCPFIVINENGTCVESLSEVVDMKDYFKAELSGVTKIIIEDSDNGN